MLSTMDLSSIDWPNVTATLIAAAIGGKVAMSVKCKVILSHKARRRAFEI